jgi:hypothetical protein
MKLFTYFLLVCVFIQYLSNVFCIRKFKLSGKYINWKVANIISFISEKERNVIINRDNDKEKFDMDENKSIKQKGKLDIYSEENNKLKIKENNNNKEKIENEMEKEIKNNLKTQTDLKDLTNFNNKDSKKVLNQDNDKEKFTNGKKNESQNEGIKKRDKIIDDIMEEKERKNKNKLIVESNSLIKNF